MAEVRLYNMVFIWVPGNSLDLASPRVCCLLLWCPLPPLLPSVLSLQFSSALKDTGEISQSLALVNGNIERDVGLSSCRYLQSLYVIHLIAPRIGGQGNGLERLWSLEEYSPALSSRDSSSPCPQYLRETRKLVITGLALLLWRRYRTPILLEIGSLSGSLSSVVGFDLWCWGSGRNFTKILSETLRYQRHFSRKKSTYVELHH